MIPNEVRDTTAKRLSLPPSLVAALEGVEPPAGLLASYGVKGESKDPVVAVTILGHALSQSFATHGRLEDALSEVLTGDPAAHRSPTSPIGGTVVGILANAATRANEGMDQFQPQNPAAFGKLSKAFGEFMKQTRDAGGPVTDEAISAFTKRTAQITPPAEPSAPMRGHAGAVGNAPMPSGPKPSDVHEFATQMKGLGIDVGHFTQHYPYFSALRRKLVGEQTGLDHYAAVSTMQPHEMLDHVRRQPHPIYPHITAGQFADMHGLASLHSLPATGSHPASRVVANLIESGAKWKEVSDWYGGQKHGV